MQTNFTQITEAASHYENLENMSIIELLTNMNNEDKGIPFAVEKALPQIEAFVEAAYQQMKKGGRLFYIGAGTSGRLGILDASEIPPTYGAPADLIVGLIAGGDHAIRYPIEFAEDDEEQVCRDLGKYNFGSQDILLGIAASGTTPYVIGGLRYARTEGGRTGCIVCNERSPVAKESEYPIEIVVGPEFVTGSTRMKSGTATKLALNMISTSLMVKMGRVKGNRMVDMQLTNEKLINRGTQMVMLELGVDSETAMAYLKQYGSVRSAVENFKKKL